MYRYEVNEAGLVGTLFAPSGCSGYPTILCLGGAEGGAPRVVARALAQSGYAALALTYFGAKGLPARLASVPLEYFLNAVAWVYKTCRPLGDFIALRGHSRGAEAALIVAGLSTQIRAIVCYVPPARVYRDYSSGGPTWTLNGREFAGSPLPQEYWEDPQLPTPDEVEGIPVEHIGAPILLLSGKDDRVWRSFQYCERLKRRLSLLRPDAVCKHLTYEAAGHAISYPPPFILSLEWGGTAEGNATATVHSWNASLAFLRTYAPQSAEDK